MYRQYMSLLFRILLIQNIRIQVTKVTYNLTKVKDKDKDEEDKKEQAEEKED